MVLPTRLISSHYKVDISPIFFRCKVLLKADVSSVSSSPVESLKHTISGLVDQTR